MFVCFKRSREGRREGGRETERKRKKKRERKSFRSQQTLVRLGYKRMVGESQNR